MLVYKHGQRVTEPTASQPLPKINGLTVKKASWSLSVSERIERLDEKIAKLTKKIGEYNSEKAGIEVAMESPVMSRDEREARQEVLRLLDAQIGKLQALKSKKTKEVHGYRNPTTTADLAKEEAEKQAAEQQQQQDGQQAASEAAEPAATEADQQ